MQQALNKRGNVCCPRISGTRPRHKVMAGDRELELAARFVAALYSATRGRRTFRSILDCARRAGITEQGDIATAWSTADRAGLVVVHISEPMVMLTEKGRQAVGAGTGGRR
jgi:hypothetical protein